MARACSKHCTLNPKLVPRAGAGVLCLCAYTLTPFSPSPPAALQAGGAALLEYLLQAGARVGAGDARAQTPLHYAIVFDNAEAAKLLLRRGASRCATGTLLCMVVVPTPLRHLHESG